MKKNLIQLLLITFALGCSVPSFAAQVNKQKNFSQSIKKKTVAKNNKSKSSASNLKSIKKKPVAKNNKSKSKINYIPSNMSGIKYVVFNYENGKIYESNAADKIWPIASLTKLMTAHTFIKNHPDLDNCQSSITDADRDRIKGTNTKLSFYQPYSCETLLQVMLAASDNYAASSLSRAIPGWTKDKFVYEMNQEAKRWGLENTSFVDSSGLSPLNKSSILDYKKLAMNVVKNPIIAEMSTSNYILASNQKRTISYRNSNRLIRENINDAELSKTGYIRESGYNLVHLSSCDNNIGVIEFGARSSIQRSNFVKDKLSKYGCHS